MNYICVLTILLMIGCEEESVRSMRAVERFCKTMPADSMIARGYIYVSAHTFVVDDKFLRDTRWEYERPAQNISVGDTLIMREISGLAVSGRIYDFYKPRSKSAYPIEDAVRARIAEWD